MEKRPFWLFPPILEYNVSQKKKSFTDWPSNMYKYGLDTSLNKKQNLTLGMSFRATGFPVARHVALNTLPYDPSPIISCTWYLSILFHPDLEYQNVRFCKKYKKLAWYIYYF
jgi:hypothetical protein